MSPMVVDVAIIGAGFSGSLLALMLHQVGRKVVLLERGQHPRFALGESSTPMTNLAFERSWHDYDLPWLLPLAKHGPWKKNYPHLPVGLKRGFTFAWHQPGQPFNPARSWQRTAGNRQSQGRGGRYPLAAQRFRPSDT